MKLEVGMYCRTKDGIIDKVILNYNGKCASPNCNCKHVSCEKDYYDEDKITKASHNIIDLIEFGDYVNGFPVEDYFHKYNEEKDIFENIGVVTTECYLENSNFSWILEKNIKTILTKEQFKNNCYKTGDE